VRVCLLRARAAAEIGDDEELARARDAAEVAENELVLDDMELIFKPIRSRIGMAREIALAIAMEQRGDRSAAADRLTRLVSGDTRWQNTYLFLLQDAAAAQLRAGNAKAARELAQRQIDEQQFPTPVAWQLRGGADFSDGNWSGAFAAWSHAERMHPNAVDHIQFATAVEQLGDAAAASRHLALAGQFAGINFFRQGKTDEARKVLRQTVSIDSEMSDVWFYLGECARSSADDRQATAAYRRCLQLNAAHGRAVARLRQLEKTP
jgi:tetratricopeptide (TPR) repeat protein